MSQTRPAEYALYREPGSGLPPFPAVLYDERLASPEVRRKKRTAYMFLVLLLTKQWRLQWAAKNQLSPFSSAEDARISPRAGEVYEAYQLAAYMKEAGVGIVYWQEEFEMQRGKEALPDFEDDDLEANESDVDEQVRQALQISREELGLSAARRHRSSLSTLAAEDEAKVYVKPCTTLKRPRSSWLQEDGESSLPISIDDKLPVRKRRKASIPNGGPSDHLSVKQGKRPQNQSSSFRLRGNLLDLNRFGPSSDKPTSDVVKGDLSQSEDFIQVPVGPKAEISFFHKQYIWNLRCFNDRMTGTNFFKSNADGVWELRHPALASIDPLDFSAVAEFLEHGDFGIKAIETEEQNKEAVAQCVSAWLAADKLGLADMLDHIASKKVEFLTWDDDEILYWAILLYTSAGLLDAHTKMRKWISEYLAHHFWSYIKNDTLATTFRKRLRILPELERDVMRIRADNLANKINLDDDEESDEDNMLDEAEL